MASSVIKMPVADWIAVAPCPIQRNTEKHAQKAQHLLTPLPVHAHVWAARLPGGSLIKLDGHTRALLWSRNIIPHPKQVEVHIIDVETKIEACEIYKTFDSKEALETTADKVSGALRGLKFTPESALIASGAFSSAMTLCHEVVYGYSREKKKDIYETIDVFSAEILAVDDLGLRNGQITTGVIAAIMLSFRKYGDKIMPFWRSVIANTGTKSGGRMDAVEAAHSIAVKFKGHNGRTFQRDICARSLNAAERWLEKEDFGGVPRPLDLQNYFDGKKPEGIQKLIRAKKKKEDRVAA